MHMRLCLPLDHQRANVSTTREVTSGEWVWTLANSGSEMFGEVCWTTYGWEFRLFLDGQFRYAHRHPTRTLAFDDAASWRRQFETSGWTTLRTEWTGDASMVERKNAGSNVVSG
jgi:hypothetical protein